MSGKPTPRSNRRAARPSVEAPAEYGFVTSDTPDPPDVAGGGASSGPPYRSLWSMIKLAVGIGLVIGTTLATAWAAHRFAMTTPRFAMQHFEVDGNRRLSDGELLRRSGIAAGQNLFALDTDAAEAKLLEDPWIRSVRVTRRLPDTLRVELVEREAGALAVIDGELFLLTVDGEPFKPFEERDPHDLPVVTGLSARTFALDRVREVERARIALEVLQIYESVPVARVYPAEEVHLEEDGQVVLTVGSSAIAVHLGLGPWRKKVLMAARVISSLQAKGAVPGVVFLDNRAHPERAVVRMR